jgi:hypothetical protein
MNMVHHSTIRPASYKGYGCHNEKPPWPPHGNTIINVRTGENAAAPFVATEIWGNIRRHLGGWKAWAIGDRAVHFIGSVRS